MRQFQPIPLLIGIVGMLVGASVGYATGWLLLGAVAGFILAAPLGAFLVRRQRRWVALSILFFWFLVSFVTGGVIAVGAAVAASALTFLLSAVVLRHLYNESELKALNHHLAIVFGLNNGFQIVENGETALPPAAGTLYGPRQLLIRPNSAAVLQRGSQLTRLVGPTYLVTEPFEYISYCFDLRQTQESFKLRDVFSADLMAMSLALNVCYCLDIGDDARLGRRPLTTEETNALLRISLHLPDWKRAVRSGVERCAREAVSLRRFDSLHDGTRTYQSLEEEIVGQTRALLEPWRIRIEQFLVEGIQPAHALAEAAASAKVHQTTELARATALREQVRLLGQSYEAGKREGLSPRQIERDLLRRTLEQMARDPANKLVFLPELEELLGFIGSAASDPDAAP